MDNLSRESEAARTLILNLKDVIADDEDLALDMIEAETGFLDAVDGALERINALDALSEAIKAQATKLAARKSRFEAQAERIKTSLALALEMSGQRKLERPLGTLSLRAVPPSVNVTSEVDIPADFWKPQAPKLDKVALLAALKDKRDIPGATLSNGGVTLSIRGG